MQQLSETTPVAAENSAGSDLAARVERHILERLGATPAEDSPFSHLYLENFFPADVYTELLRRTPDAALFKGLNHRDAVRADGSSTRQVLPFNDKNLAALAGGEREFWRAVVIGMQSPAVTAALFDKLKTDLGRRFAVQSEKARELEAYPKTGYFRDQDGYRISPHRDVARKMVTLQIYLPEDHSQVDMGTRLYTRSALGRVQYELHKRGLGENDGFRQVVQFPFVPNSAYAFVVGRHSWHGRPQIRTERERRSLMQIYYRNPEEPFYD